MSLSFLLSCIPTICMLIYSKKERGTEKMHKEGTDVEVWGEE